jgi:hypothetical protein
MPDRLFTIDGIVTINGLTIHVHNPTEAIGLRMLLDAYIESSNLNLPSRTVPPDTRIRIKNIPLSARQRDGRDNTTKGYIMQVFDQYRFPMYAADIVEKMVQYGWESNAEDKKRYVEVVMYRDKTQFQHLKGGKWIHLHDAEYMQEQDEADARVSEIIHELLDSDDNPDALTGNAEVKPAIIQ